MPWKFFTQYGAPVIPDSPSGSESSVDTGQILMYCGISEPDGFLFCDGQEVSQDDYSDLYTFFTSNSLSFGVPINPANFVLPNLLESIPVGLNTSEVEFNLVGKKGGEKTHEHTIPAHQHSTPAHTHRTSNHTHSYGNHTHPIPTHSHSKGTLVHGTPVGGFIEVTNAPGVLRAVEYAAHVHDTLGAPASHTGGATTNPKNSSNIDKDLTDYQDTTDTNGTTDSVFGDDSPASTLPKTGAGSNSTIPPYYTLNFIIKA